MVIWEILFLDYGLLSNTLEFCMFYDNYETTMKHSIKQRGTISQMTEELIESMIYAKVAA